MFTYSLSFSPFETKISNNQLLAAIKDNRKIYQWYSPFIGTYILKSYEPLTSLAESFRGLFEGAPFILSVIYPAMTGGAQSDEVWNWLNTGNLPTLEQK